MEGLLQESLGMVEQSQQVSSFFPECRIVYSDHSQPNLISLNGSHPKHTAMRRGKLQPMQNVEDGEICMRTGKIERMPDKIQHVWDGNKWKESQEDIDAAVTLVASLKACGQQNNLPEGNRIHAEIVRSGSLEKNIFVGSTLVSMYAKCGALEKAHVIFDNLFVRNVVSWNALITGYAQCGALEKAQDVFDELPYPCVISWNALIAGYVQHGHGKNALKCFEQMQSAGFSPNGVTLTCILKACGSIGALEKGQEIHAQIAKERLLEKDYVVASALVDMYAKCGALGKAQEVFNELPIQNVASWNAVITGYAQHGRGEEALKCFERMQLGGLSPTVITYTCILKACGSIGASAKGQEIHAYILRESLLEKDIVIANALIDMYAKCGALGRAHEILSELPVQDLVSWTGLIAGYAHHGQGEEALNCYEQMRQGGLSPDTATFACILKACGSVGAFDEGQQIHAQIVKECLLEKQVVVANALVDMYAKCDALEKAQQVFDAISVQDAVSWNALIAGYTLHGHSEEALNYFDEMQLRGFSPSAFTFASILTACGNIRALDKGQELHAVIMRESSWEDDLVIANALVDMYAKCGAFEKAQEIMSQLQVCDVTLCNALITEYVRQGHGEEALNCFKQLQLEGLTPDAVTFACILRACGSLGALDKGHEIHAQIMRERSLEKDNDIASALAVMYAKCGALEKAQEMLDELFVQDIVLWNAIIAGYAQNGRGGKAFCFFRLMQQECFCPNAMTFTSVLKACGSMRALDKGQEVHAQIMGDPFLKNDMVLGTALVDMYAKCGALEKAQEVLNELPLRDVVSWNALIGGYAQHELSQEALDSFEWMRLKGFCPDAVTFACILNVCGSIGAAYKGQKIHGEIVSHGLLERNINVGTALVVMYANCGMLAEAQELFDKLPVRDVVSWSALMEGYAQIGKDEIALDFFDRMIREGIIPNSITFTVILNACSHRGLLDKGQMYFETISDCYGIIPTPEHHTCMLDLFVRAGHFDKAVAVIKEMPLFANTTMWYTLLGGCQKCGLSELGKWAFEHAVQLDAKGAAAFISMSNIYAAAGREEVAGKIER